MATEKQLAALAKARAARKSSGSRPRKRRSSSAPSTAPVSMRPLQPEGPIFPGSPFNQSDMGIPTAPGRQYERMPDRNTGPPDYESAVFLVPQHIRFFSAQ